MKAEVKGITVKYPDFLIVGAARSGTTSLYHYLRQHPDIFMPKEKEPRFFMFADSPPDAFFTRDFRKPVWQLEEYSRLFEPAKEGQLLGEASVDYLAFPDEVIRNIKKYIPDWQKLKIIIILRNPIERAYSAYLHNQILPNVDSSLSLETTLDQTRDLLISKGLSMSNSIGAGFYFDNVKAYHDNFPHIKIFLYDELKKDAGNLVKDVYRFFGIDDSFAPDIEKKHNPSGVMRSEMLGRMLKPKAISSKIPLVKLIPLHIRAAITEKLRLLNLGQKPEMKEETRQYLKNFYRQDILKLQDLIKRDLSAWLE
jgi:hypothetical protein